MEIVINTCWGGFSLSEEAASILGVHPYDNVDRTDYRLVQVVKDLGERANGRCANLEVVELPDETTDWEINEYDGAETVIYVVNGKLHHA